MPAACPSLSSGASVLVGQDLVFLGLEMLKRFWVPEGDSLKEF